VEGYLVVAMQAILIILVVIVGARHCCYDGGCNILNNL
jgi:hypothetical protein